MSEVGGHQERLRLERLLPVLGALGWLWLAVQVLLRWTAGSVWDDGYMFGRYAQNLLEYGQLGYDPGCPPVWGLTSLAYLLVVVPTTAVLGQWPAAAALTASTASLLLWAGAVVVLVRQLPAALRPWLGVVVGLSAEPLAVHATSGMDTLFASACAAFALTLWLRARVDKPWRLAGLAAGSSGLFVVRPDLLLVAGCLPLGWLLWGKGPAERRAAVVAGAALVLGVAVQIGILYGYFRTPLPLPFYIKGAGGHEQALLRAYAGVAAEEQARLLVAWPLLVVGMAAPLAVAPQVVWRSWSALDRGVALALGLSWLYFDVFALQIMPFSQRFYLPTLPLWLWLAGRSVAAVLPLWTQPLTRRQLAFAAVASLLACWMLGQGLDAWRRPRSIAKPGWLQTSVAAEYQQWRSDYWPCLIALQALPDDLVLASTEVGRPLALHPRKVVVDLTGLNNRALALGQQSVAEVVLARYVDWLYLPHPEYPHMRHNLLKNPDFALHYKVFDEARLQARMGVAIRRTSRHFARLQRLLTRACTD